MNKNERIEKQGKAVLLIFPNATEKNPVSLYRKLRRIENSLARPIMQYTNAEGGMTNEKLNVLCDDAKKKLISLLGEIPTIGVNWGEGRCPDCGANISMAHEPNCKGGNHTLESILFLNRDPRGYVLKLRQEWVHHWNTKQYDLKEKGFPLHTDMGGEGILAPEY